MKKKYSLWSGYRRRYIKDVAGRARKVINEPAISESDLAHLPLPVRNYLKFAGIPGTPRVQNFHAVFSGAMKRSKDGKWIGINAEQYNYYDYPARLFYIKSSLSGIPFDGYHRYIGGEAIMQIKIANLFQIVDAKGEKMNRGETVTMFNDMCVLAPATLINSSVEWSDEEERSVSAKFSNAGNTISAKLFFGNEGELIDFISEDRYYSSDGKKYLSYPWSTPVYGYKVTEGRRIPTTAGAVWYTPEGEYEYAKFNLLSIKYNTTEPID